nr:hypothetical protein Iba_chr03cCG5760 [Ipomoea batatas]
MVTGARLCRLKAVSSAASPSASGVALKKNRSSVKQNASCLLISMEETPHSSSVLRLVVLMARNQMWCYSQGAPGVCSTRRHQNQSHYLQPEPN